MSVPRPLLTARLLRSTRIAGLVMMALVLLHYVGVIGTPPPPVSNIALYFVAGACVASLYALVDWWRVRRLRAAAAPATGEE